MSQEVDFFDYDSARATDLAVVAATLRDGVTVSELRYRDGGDSRVAALIAEPTSLAKAPVAAVILAHGGFEGGKRLFLEEAVELAQRGFLVLAADTTFPRTGDAEAVRTAVRDG